MKNCPDCAEDIQEGARVCKHCGHSFVRSGGFVIRKFLWALTLGATVLAVANGIVTFEMQSGAPQQAAAAGVSCFHVIAIYVLARAIDQLSRGAPALG